MLKCWKPRVCGGRDLSHPDQTPQCLLGSENPQGVSCSTEMPKSASCCLVLLPAPRSHIEANNSSGGTPGQFPVPLAIAVTAGAVRRRVNAHQHLSSSRCYEYHVLLVWKFCDDI